ncbi:loganic acid O-methyltransferase-like [Syzygium oleosum]|uniref:loganic acid O-methyltransferase-like n=1 Tax=Syzygium oleosum TaxID=219896 RepID=UPI0024B96933|nr:loganic acid O-methyltransferase-like [Syzygium oleosum]
MSGSGSVAVAESYPMNSGDGTYSYNKNSHFQRASHRVATNVARATIDEAIEERLDVKRFSPALTTFRIADLGCSVGPNTFIAVQNILEAVRHKYESQGLSSQLPDFQVLFNDHAANDFNTLFASLPSDRLYYAAGVPGSLHGRLFPKASLHIAHSSYALHWLSKMPKELVDPNSPAFNKGRVHYTSAPREVSDAYASQFAKDMVTFLSARGEEIVSGGIMVLVMPGIANGIPHSRVPSGVMFDLLGFSLMDMAKEGIISEAQVDTFNLPVYATSPDEMTALVESNGCFSIERMDLAAPKSKLDDSVGGHVCMLHLRAALEGIISKHFGSEIIDDLFDRFLRKTEEFSDHLNSAFLQGSQLVAILKRI